MKPIARSLKMNSTQYNYFIESTTFSWWAYLPFLDFFMDPEEFSLDFKPEDFDPYYPDDETPTAQPEDE